MTTIRTSTLETIRAARDSAKAKALETPEVASFAAGMASAYSLALIFLYADTLGRCELCTHDIEDHDDYVCNMAMCMCSVDHEEEEPVRFITCELQVSAAASLIDLIGSMQEGRAVTETDVLMLSHLRSELLDAFKIKRS
jgi:hypothetical protein